MIIIKYQTFNSSKEFEKWQLAHPLVVITQIIPCTLHSVISKELDYESNGSIYSKSETVKNKHGIFITYFIKEENNAV